MLRAILLASPVVLIAVVSCGDSSSSFDDVPSDTGGTSSSLGGVSSAGKGSQAGSPITAGSGNKAGAGNTGGTKNTAGTGNSAGNANQAGTASQAGTTGQAGTSGQAGTTGQAGSENGGAPSGLAGAPNDAGAAGAAGAGGNSGGALCPDVFGTYEIKNKEGTCNGLNKDAPQTIEGTTAVCAAHFVSAPPNGAQGVNGAADLDDAGNFSGSKLFLDMTQRNPCSGTWNAQEDTMTLECGGQGDLCTVLLKRK